MARKEKIAFVLDTCVYGNDPQALFQFKEHDIYIPMTVLKELDNHKTNYKKPELAKNARQTSRYFLELLKPASPEDIAKGLPLSSVKSHYGKKGPAEKTGKVFFETNEAGYQLTAIKPDDTIINFAIALQKKLEGKAKVIFVTQDIIAFTTAKICGIWTEEYKSGKALDDVDLLFSGTYPLPSDFWATASKESTGVPGEYLITSHLAQYWHPNHFIYRENGEIEEYLVKSTLCNTAIVKEIIDYRKPENSIWGLHALNREQNFFMNALMNPDIHFVSGAGKAGSGKTLLAIAAAFQQVADSHASSDSANAMTSALGGAMKNPSKRYDKIIITKEAIPIGEDIGFFPGSEEKKMAPWMRAFTDNIEFLVSQKQGYTFSEMKRFYEMVAIGPMQGRTFHKKFIIFDETQNSTPKQMLDLITRAGPGTKWVCLGNIKQIATPYLTGEASGLTHVVEAFKPCPIAAHVTLMAGERSPLAEFAANNL